jgi:hypothetical protein
VFGCDLFLRFVAKIMVCRLLDPLTVWNNVMHGRTMLLSRLRTRFDRHLDHDAAEQGLTMPRKDLDAAIKTKLGLSQVGDGWRVLLLIALSETNVD